METVVAFFGILALIILGGWMAGEEDLKQGWVFYVGIWITLAIFIVTTRRNKQVGKTQESLKVLQTLRTDSDYIAASVVLKPYIKRGTPLSQLDVNKVLAPPSVNSRPHDPANPSFQDAATLVLNQYEFIASGIRLGAMDEELFEETIKSIVIRLVVVFMPLIERLRAKRATTFQNLVWLYAQYVPRGSIPPELGPIPSRKSIWY